MDGYILRPSAPGDECVLKALWQTVFGDEDSFIDAFFDILYSPGDAVVAEISGAPAAAGYCLAGPVASGLRCSYIYAMATYEAHRGRGLGGGIARQLMERAFESGADVVATLPASDSLCAWYGRVLGMEPVFKKGGAGVVFPECWDRFAALCGGHDPETPDRLWAVCRGGIDPAPLTALGWEHCFD